MRGKCAEGKSSLLLLLKTFLDNCLEEFFGDHVVEASVEVIKIEGSIAIFSSEHSGNCDILEFVIKEGPLVAKSNHILNTLLTFLLERCGEGDLRGGVWC